MSGEALLVVHTLSAYTLSVFVYSGGWIYVRRLMYPGPVPPVVRRVFTVVRPLFWPAFGVHWLADIALEGPLDFWEAFILLNQIWCWWVLRREDGDDTWKRLRDKVAEKVKSLGHRLVVVPQA